MTGNNKKNLTNELKQQKRHTTSPTKKANNQNLINLIMQGNINKLMQTISNYFTNKKEQFFSTRFRMIFKSNIHKQKQLTEETQVIKDNNSRAARELINKQKKKTAQATADYYENLLRSLKEMSLTIDYSGLSVEITKKEQAIINDAQKKVLHQASEDYTAQVSNLMEGSCTMDEGVGEFVENHLGEGAVTYLRENDKLEIFKQSILDRVKRANDIATEVTTLMRDMKMEIETTQAIENLNKTRSKENKPLVTADDTAKIIERGTKSLNDIIRSKMQPEQEEEKKNVSATAITTPKPKV